MRWWWAVALGVGLWIGARPLQAAPTVAARQPTSILIDALTGEPLREQDADAPRPQGSLRQLMVLLLTLEQSALGGLPLDVPVTISDSALGVTPAASMRIPLHRDAVYVLSDLLKAMTVAAASDATVAVAEAVAGSPSACLELMNARAQRLGLQSTHYSSLDGANLKGLAPDATSARDLSRLALALLQQPLVLEWSALSGVPFDGGAVLLRNTNQLIGALPGADGLLASSVPAAGARGSGFSVLATAQRGPLRLIAAVLDAPDSATRYRSAAELLEWGFAHYERLEVVRKGEPLNVPVRVMNGAVRQLTPIAGRTFSLLRRRDDEPNLEVHYQLPNVLMAPLTRHQPIGEIVVEEKGALIAVIPLLSPARVDAASILSAALP